MQKLLGDTLSSYILKSEIARNHAIEELEHSGLSPNDIEFVVYDADTFALVYVAEHYKDEYRPQAQKKNRFGVILNPKQRQYFDKTDQEYRPALETLDWFNLPYIIHYPSKSLEFPNGIFEVFMLDGGSHERATSYYQEATLEEAAERAHGLMNRL